MIGIGYGGFPRRISAAVMTHTMAAPAAYRNRRDRFPLIYFSLIFSFWTKVRKLKLSSPAFISIVFIIIYVTSHNKEIASVFRLPDHGVINSADPLCLNAS